MFLLNSLRKFTGRSVISKILMHLPKNLFPCYRLIIYNNTTQRRRSFSCGYENCEPRQVYFRGKQYCCKCCFEMYKIQEEKDAIPAPPPPPLPSAIEQNSIVFGENNDFSRVQLRETCSTPIKGRRSYPDGLLCALRKRYSAFHSPNVQCNEDNDNDNSENLLPSTSIDSSDLSL